MHAVYIQHLSDVLSKETLSSSVQKDTKNTLVCVCHTAHSTLTDALHRYCNDTFLAYEINEQDPVVTFTEILEHLNAHLDELSATHKKSDISLFIGLISDNHIHFSMFGKNLTGMLVSPKNTEDIFQGMDNHEGHFTYDSHGEIQLNESIYVFAPKIDLHIVQQESKTLDHLNIGKRCELLAERVERSNHDKGIILAIGREEDEERTAWKPEKITPLSHKITAVFETNTKNMNDKIQGVFRSLSDKAQNWMLISGLLVSIILLYIILSGLLKSQYAIFVPQKYKDILAEARVEMTNASKALDKPEQFGPAIVRTRELLQQVKSKNVLQVDVEQIEKELAVLEKSINKVISLTPEQYKKVYTFSNGTESLPFGMYVADKKLFFVTQKSVIGPYVEGQATKESTLPEGASSLSSDIDGDGRIYITTDKDKIYLFDKGTLTSLGVQQVGGWDKSSDISVYNSNIYLLSSDKRQIYKHRKQSENMYTGKSLVITPETQTSPIINMDIDGSVWLLSGTNSIKTEKILTAPKYERRGIVMNNLGINTFVNTDPSVTKIYADPSYQEVYILADNRIWIFVPNSKRFSDVKSLSYIGQIDVQNIIISDIVIQQSGDVREIFFGSPKSDIYSTKFSVTDNKIHIFPNN
ncbi:MAG: hypothetical protein WC753_00530 [Candidatus Gracilibacteria bacterium]